MDSILKNPIVINYIQSHYAGETVSIIDGKSTPYYENGYYLASMPAERISMRGVSYDDALKKLLIGLTSSI